MVALNGTLAGFGAGALLALALNLELVANILHVRGLDVERGLGRESDRAMVMRWIKRTLLVILPLGFAAVGYASADDLFGGTV